jgi:hypothetical protein
MLKRTPRVVARAVTIVATMVVACSIVLTLAAAAIAQPQGIFGVFAQCPTSIPGDELCISGEVVAGEVSIGPVGVPIDKGLLLRGGGIPVGYPEHPSEIEFFVQPPKNGETLSKTELEIPGGLHSVLNVNCASLGTACGVTATLEPLIGPRDRAIINEFDLFSGEAAGIILPARIRLNNLLLGHGCYIGSESSPLQLRLTTGATHPPAGFGPLQGDGGIGETLEDRGLVAFRDRGVSLVDNTFLAPGAEGCGLFRSAIDSRLKIPNKAGENAAVLKSTLFIASSDAVLASEKW